MLFLEQHVSALIHPLFSKIQILSYLTSVLLLTRVVQSLFQQYDRSPSRVVVNKNQVSRSEDEAKKEVAATIEDEDEEDKEIMEVLGAEEVDTELDYEVDSEMTTITECSQKMKCI